MVPEHINADFSRTVLLNTNQLPWLASPQSGVERRMLDRIGGEVARATSIVRYAASSTFPAHVHDLGEEFLVLDGVFSDERGDYPKGTYVRNPPGSRHAPRTEVGCLIFVKLRQMRADEHQRVVIETARATFETTAIDGVERILLFSLGEQEEVGIERIAAGGTLPETRLAAGEEMLLLEGDLDDGNRQFGPQAWMRRPAGALRTLSSRHGAVYWFKRGHLGPADPPA